MANRRQFLKASAGLCFVGCGLTHPHAAHAQPTAKRREVAVNGKRARTIDIHSHCMIPAALAAMGEATVTAAGPVLTSYPGLYLDAAAQRMKAMDQQGIDMEVLSINPIWYSLERDAATKVIEIQNEALAEFTAAHAERFLAFASVSLQHPDLAIAQLERAIKRQGLRGVAVGWERQRSRIREREVPSFLGEVRGAGDPRLHPPAKHAAATRSAERQRAPWQHDRQPARHHHRALAPHLRGHARQVSRAEGLRGARRGYLGSYAPRSDHGCLTFPDQCDKAIVLKKKPTEYLRQIYVDNIVFTPEAMRHLDAEIGYDRIMLGTDYPLPWKTTRST